MCITNLTERSVATLGGFASQSAGENLCQTRSSLVWMNSRCLRHQEYCALGSRQLDGTEQYTFQSIAEGARRWHRTRYSGCTINAAEVLRRTSKPPSKSLRGELQPRPCSPRWGVSL
eukprot:6245065-Amphidinium_carterae.1